MGSDIKKLVKELQRQGFEVTRTKSGHYDIRLNGRRVTTYSGTPSDKRGWHNFIAALRRAGFIWPH